MKYGMRSMGYLEYRDSTFHKCSANPYELCFGTEGKTVLRRLHEVRTSTRNSYERIFCNTEFFVQIYATVGPNDTFLEDLGVTLLLAVIFKIAYIYVFLKKSRAASGIHKIKE